MINEEFGKNFDIQSWSDGANAVMASEALVEQVYKELPESCISFPFSNIT